MTGTLGVHDFYGKVLFETRKQVGLFLFLFVVWSIFIAKKLMNHNNDQHSKSNGTYNLGIPNHYVIKLKAHSIGDN